jgi:hypothetical protein
MKSVGLSVSPEALRVRTPPTILYPSTPYYADPMHPKSILQSPSTLELLESLGRRLVLGHTEDVESDGLGQRTALADGDLVAVLNTESGGAVGSEVLVAFLVSAVFGDAAGSAGFT